MEEDGWAPPQIRSTVLDTWRSPLVIRSVPCFQLAVRSFMILRCIGRPRSLFPDFGQDDHARYARQWCGRHYRASRLGSVAMCSLRRAVTATKTTTLGNLYR